MLGAHGGAGYTFAAAAASAASAAVMRERRWPAATTAASHGSRECQWQPRRPREATTLLLPMLREPGASSATPSAVTLAARPLCRESLVQLTATTVVAATAGRQQWPCGLLRPA